RGRRARRCPCGMTSGIGQGTVLIHALRQVPGLELDELPDDYAQGLLGLDHMRDPLRSALEWEWKARTETDTEAGSSTVVMSAEVAAVAEALITAGYRALARRHHPDHGGDGAARALL